MLEDEGLMDMLAVPVLRLKLGNLQRDDPEFISRMATVTSTSYPPNSNVPMPAGGGGGEYTV